MQNDWFFDVLSDLRDYAEANDLAAVAERLDTLRRVAEAEMPVAGETPPAGPRVTHGGVGVRRLH